MPVLSLKKALDRYMSHGNDAERYPAIITSEISLYKRAAQQLHQLLSLFPQLCIGTPGRPTTTARSIIGSVSVYICDEVKVVGLGL